MALYLGNSKIGGVAVNNQNNKIETCTLTVNLVNNGMSAINKLVLNTVKDGKILLNEKNFTDISNTQTFIVPCNSFVFMYGTGGGIPNPTHSDNVTLIDNFYTNTHIYLYKMPDTPNSTATITHICE